MIRKVDLTGVTPYYLKIEYRHKQNEPCLILRRKWNNVPIADIVNDTWAITELKQSPFFIKPVINLELVDYSNTGKQFLYDNYHRA